jgi:ribosomal protein L7/L12
MDEKENEKVERALDVLDGIDYSALSRELWDLNESFDFRAYPNIVKLAEKQSELIRKMPLREAADFFGKDRKIGLIKEIRSRKNLDLWEAKMMADGIFKEKGWSN